MRLVAPCDLRLSKSLGNLEIAVTYNQIPGNSNELDCTIEFKNTIKKDEEGAENGETVEDHTQPEEKGLGFVSSWLGRSGSEKSQLTTKKETAASVFLGYVQLVGYVRLNNDFNGGGSTLSAREVFWKNSEYASRYPIENEHEKVEAILQTPLFNEEDTLSTFKSKLAGWPDFKAGPMDNILIALLHDLAYSFNSREPAAPDHTDATAQESTFINDFAQCIVPFYVTSQHLLFSSTRIEAGDCESYKLRVPIPSNSLPPSYNTALTGFTGDNGLVSICYQFVIGLLNEGANGMTPRNVYFPWEFHPSQTRTEHGWSQPDYLQKPMVDKDWRPREVDDIAFAGRPVPKQSNKKSSSAKAKLEAELDNLINSSVEIVAAKERRKSSVSILTREESGYIPQIPTKARVSYQIMVNSNFLCLAHMSKATYRVGEDIHFSLDLPSSKSLTTRVVGAVAHVEAHEIFHLNESRKLVNVYKVSPSVKLNTYSCALAISDANDGATSVASMISLPQYLTQQFQASTLMDLKYFLVFSLVLNEFDEEHQITSLDQEDDKAVSEYIRAYKNESEFHKFKFSVPLTVLP